MKKTHYIIIYLIYLLIIILSIRPYIPQFYSKMYGIDVGGWVMYKYELVPTYSLYLESDNEIINFDANNFIWHGTFGDSAHPNYNRVAMMKFLELFSKKPKIEKIIKNKNIDKLTFSMELKKNKKFLKKITVTKKINK